MTVLSPDQLSRNAGSLPGDSMAYVIAEGVATIAAELQAIREELTAVRKGIEVLGLPVDHERSYLVHSVVEGP